VFPLLVVLWCEPLTPNSNWRYYQSSIPIKFLWEIFEEFLFRFCPILLNQKKVLYLSVNQECFENLLTSNLKIMFKNWNIFILRKSCEIQRSQDFHVRPWCHILGLFLWYEKCKNLFIVWIFCEAISIVPRENLERSKIIGVFIKSLQLVWPLISSRIFNFRLNFFVMLKKSKIIDC